MNFIISSKLLFCTSARIDSLNQRRVQRDWLGKSSTDNNTKHHAHRYIWFFYFYPRVFSFWVFELRFPVLLFYYVAWLTCNMGKGSKCKNKSDACPTWNSDARRVCSSAFISLNVYVTHFVIKTSLSLHCFQQSAPYFSRSHISLSYNILHNFGIKF